MTTLAKFLNKPLFQRLFCGTATALASLTVTATPLDLADSPLFITVNMPPNLVLTLDDSLSMPAASVPDDIGSQSATKRFKSHTYNALYFDPSATYAPPPRHNGSNCTIDVSNPSSCYPNVSFTAAPINGFDTTRGTVNLSSGYKATNTYSPQSTTQTYGDTTAGAAYYYTFNAGNTNCNGTSTDEDCYTKVTVSASQQQNFANWYSYYRTRNLAVVSSTMRAFSGVDGSIRVAWQALDSCNSFGTNCDGWGAPGLNLDNRIKRLNATTPVTTTTTTPVTTTATTTYSYTCSAYFDDNDSNTDRINLYSSSCNRTLPSAASGAPPSLGTGSPANANSSHVTVSGAGTYSKTYTVSSVEDRTSPTRVRLYVPSSITSDSADPITNVTFTWTATETTTTNVTTSTTTDVSHKEDLYNWLSRFPVTGSTHLIRAANNAGKYFQGTIDIQHPYAEDPQITDGTHYSCRRNVHLMMTDGGWCGSSNSDTYKLGTTTQIGDANSTAVTVPLGPNNASNYSWTPAAPYRDGQGNNLSDIAFYYWATDLQSGLTNDLLPITKDTTGDTNEQWRNPKNDPATWQHLNTYTVGFGLKSTLVSPFAKWGGSTFAGDNNGDGDATDVDDGDYPKLALGTSCPTTTTSSSPASPYCWPYTNTAASCPPSDQQEKTYDLWHAAISSRGKFFSSESSDDLVTAFNTILSEVTNDSASSAAAAANSTNIQAGTVLYQAQFSSLNWSGHFYNFAVSSDGSVHDLNYDGKLDINDANWDAATLVPASRNIVTYNGSTGASFDWADLTAAQKTALKTSSAGVVGSDTLGQDRLDWLRGVTSKEQRFTGGVFRNRTVTVLGDTINSDPIFTHTEDYGYTSLPNSAPEKSSYAGFVTDKTSGPAPRPPMVYIGANDGMLHAFRADTGNANSGRERFAYVPAGVYDNLSSLTEPGYTHQYFVDGAPNIGDAFVSGQWKTVLLGGLNKGGKSIYALDISNPDTFSATDVLWEYSGANTDTDPVTSLSPGSTTDADGMGLTFSQPQIARLDDGTVNGVWAAIFGNGYNSTSEKAFLYIVDLSTGALIRKIPTNSATSNGLSTPKLYDSNDDKIIDAVYAGDLQGNLWKFDLSTGSSTNWGLSNGGNPLFSASNTSSQIQPITAPPTISKHVDGGILLYFGTGSYLTSADVSNTDVQSFYAIWDKPTATGTVARTDLVQQTITDQIASGSTKTNADGSITTFDFALRTTSANTVDYSVKRGWYLDLVPPAGTGGERVISSALVKLDRVIFLTAIPSTDPCVPGGDSWLMELDLNSGGATGTSSFDFNNDNQFDDKDKPNSNTASGIKSTVGMVKAAVWLDSETPGIAVKEMSGTSGNILSVKNKGATPPPTPPGSSGTLDRLYWLQIQ